MSNSKYQFPNYKQIPNPNFQNHKLKVFGHCFFDNCILFRIWFLVIGILVSGCASGPSSYFRLKPASGETHVKAAIVPFTNLTSEKEAEKKVAYALITHLLSTNYFDIIETGEVQKAMRDAKVRKDEDLSLENIKSIGQLTGADVLLMGVVEEYKIDSGTLLGEKIFVPEVAVSIRLVSTKDGSIVWAVNHHRRGDDRVTIFGMGRVDSISNLTDIIIRDSIDSLMQVMRKKRNALVILKNNTSSITETPAKVTAKKKIENKADKKDAGRQRAIEDALKKAREKNVHEEEARVAKDQETKSIEKPLVEDSREALKGSYKKEYEAIKQQY